VEVRREWRGQGAVRQRRGRPGLGTVFIHSGALHNTRLEPTALSRRFAEVVEPAAEALSGGSLPGPHGGSAASR